MAQEKSKKKMLIAASIAGILAIAGAAAGQAVAQAAEGDVPCYGVNSCKGTGECGGKSHSCAGLNECKAQGWVSLPADECLATEGGRLTADVEAPAAAE